MKNNILLIEKDSFFNTPFYNSILEDVFTNKNYRFIETYDQRQVVWAFESKENALNDFYQFDPEIETVYFDLSKGEVLCLIVSIRTRHNKITYCLLERRSQNKFWLLCNKGRYDDIDVNRHKERLINKEISKVIIKTIINKTVNEVSSLCSGLKYNLDNVYYIDALSVEEKAKAIIKYKCAQNDIHDISIYSIGVDISDLNAPEYVYAEIIYQDKKYHYSIYEEEMEEVSDFHLLGNQDLYIKDIMDIATHDFINKYSHLVNEQEIENQKKQIEQFILNRYSNKFTIECNDGAISFNELGDYYFIYLQDKVFVDKVREDESDSASFDYEELLSDKKPLIKAIDDYILSKPKSYEEYLKKANTYLESVLSFEDTIAQGHELLNSTTSIPTYDKNSDAFKAVLEKIKAKIQKFENVDKEKISKVLGLIKSINNDEDYNDRIDELCDAIDELNDAERIAVEKEYGDFLNKFEEESKYLSSDTIHRRVFIKKDVLKEIVDLDTEQTNLHILKNLNEVVDKLKTIPGKELGKYLLEKGLNFPIKEDRSIKKIRIMRHAKYRIVFTYGSDIDDRIQNNYSSIYIFGVTKHKKDKGELYTFKDKKPTKYKINDYIIYPNDRKVRRPECTNEQYKIATSAENHPVVTFGCAGSGKTTVSIEQYDYIVRSMFNSVSPKADQLVYITFHDGLSKKAYRDLAESKIEGNCFTLLKYLAHVVNEDIEGKQFINESLFISWFEKTYSEAEIEKNKNNKKKKISALLDTTGVDIDRLLYTYYRGIFKGSRRLMNSLERHLSFSEFKEEMRDEEYLSDEEKEAIFNICVEFDDYAKDNDLLSDNDYALKVIKQAHYGINKTNCIIIDEVQDLTEIEIIAIIMTLNDDSQRIYFYGDPHQSINPNIFTGSTINSVYTELGKTSSSATTPLTITYRTNKNLIKYLNLLLKYREKWIGLTKGGQSQIEQPSEVDEETSWAGYVINKDLYANIFKANPDSMIITPNDRQKRELLKRYSGINADRVSTIYEAKGREWDTVIMYNMFTDYEKYFVDMINLKAKKSTIHRMTFNKYYVACTRSTKSFVIVEEDLRFFEEDNIIFKTFLSSFGKIYKEEQIDTYLLENNTFDGWYREAVQSLEIDDNTAFEHNLQRAERLATTVQQKRMVRELLEQKPETLERYGLLYLKEGEYDLARSAFIKCNKKTKKHGPYILLAVLLDNKDLKEDAMKVFIKQKDLMKKYPEVLPKVVAQKEFKAILANIKERLKKESE